MTFANSLPWWALLGVGAAAALVAWFAYRSSPLPGRRRRILAALRFVTLIVLVMLLMRPVSRGDAVGQDAVVPILVDTSRSMSIEDADGARRIDRARDVLAELVPALTPHVQVEVFGFGESLSPAAPGDLTPSGRRSDLAGALAAVHERYRGRALAGVVLVSDGGETPVPQSTTRALPPTGAPVFPIPVGSPSISADREVLSLTAAEAILDRSRVELAVAAVSHGYGTTPIELRLLENGRPIEVRRVVPASSGAPVQVAFQVEPGTGSPTIYTVAIPTAAGELVPENNTRSLLVPPPSRPRRVLLVQGAPGFEHAFLRRALTGDGGLEVDSVVRQGRNDQGADTFYIQAARARGAGLASGYPSRRQELFAYDAIVLANVDGAFLTSEGLQATRDFVGIRGGGLIVLGARSLAPGGLTGGALAEVLPLDPANRDGGVLQVSGSPPRGANRVMLTTAGESHPLMQLALGSEETRKRWDGVPPLAAITPVGGPRPGASVLALTSGPGGTSRALIAVHRYGEGRSMAFTGEASWRWRMLLPAADRSYDTFWRQALRWIALPAADPVMVTTPEGVAPGEGLTISVAARSASFEALRDPIVGVHVTTPDGREESLPVLRDEARWEAGFFSAAYRASEPGVHRVTVDVGMPQGPVTRVDRSFLVGGADTEMADPRLNLAVLERLAAASAGRIVLPGEGAALIEILRGAASAESVRVQRELWHTGWAFTVILALLSVEWLIRRRWGLR